MLISHRFHFIYLKTMKTASHSVEMYFAPYCRNPVESIEEKAITEEAVSEFGVVGRRGPLQGGETWYNHMPAQQILAQVGDKVWKEYFKFCVIRNPFDKVVSQFWFKIRLQNAQLHGHLQTADFSEVRSAFREWSGLRQFPHDKKVFMIDGAVVTDYFIRYERLAEGLEQVCGKLGIPWDPASLGRQNGNFRPRAEHFLDYYDAETTDRVRKVFSWELENFGYTEVPSLEASA